MITADRSPYLADPALLTGQVLRPLRLARIAEIDQDVAYARLKRSCAYGQAERLGRGRYRITTDSLPILRALVAPKHQGQRTVIDAGAA